MGVYHQLPVRARSLPRQPQTLERTLQKVQFVQAPDTNLDGPKALASIAEHLVGGSLWGAHPPLA